MKIKVRNMLSARSGREVANQFIISTRHGDYFQSYRTMIARDSGGRVTLDHNWDCSRTTMKYLSQFLNGENAASIRKKIDQGVYKVTDLN